MVNPQVLVQPWCKVNSTMALIVTVFVLSFVSASYTANILAIIPTPSYSHQIAFTALWKELSLRGHNVTLITTDPLNDEKLINLTEIDIRWSYKYFINITSVADSGSFSFWNLMETFMEMFLPMVKEQLSYPAIQDLIHNKGNFDVVLVEHIYPEFLGFAEIYDCPKILVGSLDTWSHLHDFMGNLVHPVLYPELAAPFYGELSFKERLISTLYTWHINHFYYRRGYPEKEKIMHEYFNTSVPLLNLIKDIDLLILNVNPVIQNVRAIGPTTINIGGYRPSLEASPPLPKDLQEFLDSAKNGFIYFSLGSNVKSQELGQQTLNSIIATLGEVPYKVLWKFEADALPGKPNNVKIIKWAPQQQVLAHRNIKLFITQGGLQSMEEGIYAEVPFVVIPYFADQDQNARLMETKEIAKIVKKDPFIDRNELKTAILEVIQNPSYKSAVVKLKQLSLDFPMTGPENAIWWIEHVIRNKGTKHLRNPAADLPAYQYYLLDVLGFLLSIAILSVCLVVISLRYLFRWISQHTHKTPSKLKEQ